MEFVLRFARFVPALFGQFGFPAPELAFEAVGDQIDGLVEIVSVIFGMKIRSGKGKMDFDDEGLLVGRSFRRVVLDGDVSSDNSILVTLELL